MRILGIDPGLVTTGYGVIHVSGAACKLVEAGVIRTEQDDPLEQRIRKIYSEIRQVIDEFKPNAVAVEELYTHYDHPTTATLMGHARGVVFLAAAELDLPVASYAPTRIKKALTGSGRAGKMQVQRMVQASLGLARVDQPDHVTDALAAALCHANVLSRSILMQQSPVIPSKIGRSNRG
ncbi:MAG TPA: crossover junction endodeoxyribonuclease RuvC [Planctomycetota bacterium]|nr:crossover junction endodeoxyribonuclease RuvC [Planctomycetota bacterium]